MTDHAHELRRYARKIAHPAGDVPAVMAAAADWIEHLQAKSEAAEKERDNANAAAVGIALQVGALQAECDELCTKIAAMEKQEPLCWTTQLALELGSSALGFDACRRNLWGSKGIPLYALPGAKGD